MSICGRRATTESRHGQRDTAGMLEDYTEQKGCACGTFPAGGTDPPEGATLTVKTTTSGRQKARKGSRLAPTPRVT